MRKFFKKSTFIGLGMFLFASPAHAETVLTLSSWLPPSHPVVAQMIVPWTKNVEQATDGRVKIKILAKGLGHPKVHFDIARKGLADITYSVHGYTPGRFLATKAVEFPFMGDSAEALSVAYWRIHEKYLTKADEHKGTQLLSVFTHGPGAIHNGIKPVTSVADLDGIKLRVGGGIVNEVAQRLGAVPLMKPSSKNYELLSHGVADGTLFPLESVTAFKIEKMVPYTTLVPGGLYNTSFFLVMNEKRFKALPREDQDAIMSVSGEAFAKLAGQVWDAADAKALEDLKAAGSTIVTADDAFVAEVHAKTDDLADAWIEAIAAKGIDGAAVLDDIQDITSNYKK